MRSFITPGRRAFVRALSTATMAATSPTPRGSSNTVPRSSYASDNLTNNEIGWKTEFFDHRLQWNGAVYREDWNNVQVAFFDPGVLGNVGFGTNGPNYRIHGVETSFVAVLTEGLTAQGGAAWNTSKQTNSPYLVANNPALLVESGEQGRIRTADLRRRQSVRSHRRSERQLAAAAVQRAAALSVDDERLQFVRAGRARRTPRIRSPSRASTRRSPRDRT